MAVAMLSVPLQAITRWTTMALAVAQPLRYDLYIDRVDSLMGSPAFLLGRDVAAHATLREVLRFAYDNLPLVMVGVLSAYLWLATVEEAKGVFFAFIVNLAAAVPIYLLIPVSGPAFAFPGFPAHHPAGMPHPIRLDAVPNGIPSVHTSTAILILWFLWRWPLGRLAGVVYLALIVCGTLGSGQHYLFDLICAVPYTFAVLWLAQRIDIPAGDVCATRQFGIMAGLTCRENIEE